MLLKDIHKTLDMRSLDVALGRVSDHIIEDYNLNMSPDYQRGKVWTQEQKAYYMGFILEGGKTLPLIINVPSDTEAYAEIVDGKQRLTAIQEWLNGKFAATLHDGTEVYLSDFKDDVSLRLLNTSVRIKFGLVKLSRREVLEYYLRFNTGGSIHTEDEIEKVRELLRELK